MEEEAKAIVKDYESTVQTWSPDHKPKFESKVTIRGNNAYATVTSNAPDKIYQYVNQGTKVRRAIMPKDFQPKTARGRIESVSVSGGRNPVFVGKNIARPGIKGRQFNAAIRKKHAETFPKLMTKYIQEGFKVSFRR